ncbi:DUF4380 domain-containing protein [Amycolatopsis sp. NPDC051903]|uniref:DUF4380 domain-containing protein n=1 Tax=Amycolatopsis sp. NPDC051903 TaxID=3363936 RepID=UPI00378EE7AB
MVTDVHWLDNGVLRLGVVPALGGRLLSLVHGGAEAGVELLWRNPAVLGDDLRPLDGRDPVPNSGRMGDWVNYGGDKTWPAPQGWDGPEQWAGPPDPVLDSGPFSVSGLSGTAITLTSAVDPRTGLRLTREFTLGSGASYTLRLTAENCAERPVRWALWNVTQLPGGGAVTAGLASVRTPAVVELVAGTGNPKYTVDGATVVVPPQDVVGKLGVPDTAGWVSCGVSGVTLTLSFDVESGAEYPDAGSPLEIWLEHPLPAPIAELGDLDPPARIVELEALGPLTTLAPGEKTSLTVTGTVSEG